MSDSVMSVFEALARALREDRIELVLVQHAHGWDLSAMHKNAGVLSTLLSDGEVLVNGQPMLCPKSGMPLRRTRRKGLE